MRPLDYILLFLLIGGYLFYYIYQKRKRKVRRQRRPGSRLTRREQAALRKLQTRGFKLEEIHPTVPVTITYEQKSKTFDWEGNFTVAKRGKIHLVKVIRGDDAASSAAVRRELLLDYLLYQPNGFFVYDGEKEQLQELNFSFDSGGGSGGGREKLLLRLALIVLILVGLALLYSFIFRG
ncbi:MAG: hypothetical protein AB1767_07515 [Bacillota bacterium]